MPFNTERDQEELVALRQKLHAMAELSGREKQTAAVIEDFLKATAAEKVVTGVGGNGILATYKGNADGPHVLLRCELDALPIEDDIETDYRSKTEGVGHKCGHDGHMAILCGVARLLQNDPLEAGTVTLLFQPAEETGEGAKRVLEDPKYQQLSPDYCFALHNLPGFRKHQIVIREAVFAAASVGMIINFTGETAHAAHPEQGRSPALAMAQTVQALSAVPQFFAPLEKAAKVTVINAELGERAFGTSPGAATVMATLRTYEDELLEKLREKCIQLARRMAQTYELAVDIEWVEPFPATVNDAAATQVIRSAAEQLEYDIHPKAHPFSWSEDFGHFTDTVKGAMFGLGTGNDHPALHAQSYDFDDDIITTGSNMFMKIIKNLTADK